MMAETRAADGRFADPAKLDDSPNRAIAVGSAVTFMFFVVFLGWAALVRLDAAAYGQGQVTVMGNRQVVQHRYGGNVERILVHEGQRVRVGDVLLLLSGSEVAATERSLAATVIGLQAQRARLEAEVNGTAIRWPADFADPSEQDRPLVAAAERLQRSQFDSRRALLASSRAVLDTQGRQLAAQAGGFSAQERASAAQRASLQAQMESTRRLADGGDVSRNTVRALERSLAEIDGNNADFASRAVAAGEQIASVRQQVAQIGRQSMVDAANLLRETQFQLNDALPKWISAREQLERNVVRASASGRIVDLKVHSTGGVVTAGQPILEIVPDAAPLEIRANFAPENIDGVKDGQKAEVRFLSIHDRDLPIITGMVRTVSADSVQDERTGLSHFTAEIIVPRDQLALLGSVRGSDTGIRPGVPVQVTVPLRRRTALQYMFDPLSDSVSHSFSER